MVPVVTSPGHRSRPAVSVHLRIRVERDREDELRFFLREAIPFYESPGESTFACLVTRARQIEVVDYDSEHAYWVDEERARSDATMAAYLARWRAILAEPPAVETYLEIDTT